jgi:hypothetical protein
MNSTRGKLFVRRNKKTNFKLCRGIEWKYNRSIRIVAPLNENTLLAGVTGITSYDNLLEKDNAQSLHKQLKPLLIILRLFGCFPVYFSKSGEYKHTHTHRYMIISLKYLHV